jgi:polar amino acid transport system substrate-binding protein
MLFKLFVFVFVFCVAFVAFDWVGLAHADDEKKDNKRLTFSVVEDNKVQADASKIISVLYKRIGIDVDFTHLPGRRALRMSSVGQTDGEVFRIKKIEKTYPTLLRVPTALLSLSGHFYAVNQEPLQSIVEVSKRMKIAVLRGIIWSENAVKGKAVIIFADNQHQLADKLLSGSVDYVLTTRGILEDELKQRSNSIKITRSEPVRVFHVYHYLHKRWGHLVPLIDAEIKRAIASGDMESLSGMPYIPES